MKKQRRGPRGRGAQGNPLGRFEHLEVLSEEAPTDRVATQYLQDDSRTIVARNESPDVPFLDFETRILVKDKAPQFLRSELDSPGWQPQVLGMSDSQFGRRMRGEGIFADQAATN